MTVTKAGTLARQLMQGASFGAGDEISDVIGALIASKATGQNAYDLLQQARQMSKDELSQDYKNNPNGSLAANLIGGMATGGTEKKIVQALLGSLTGAASADDNLQSRLGGAASGAVFGLGGSYLPSAISRVTKGASDLISPSAQQAAQKLKQMGITPRLSQLMDSKFLSAIDTAISKVPFSGAKQSQDAQRKAFTKQLASTFGIDADTIDQGVLAKAKDELSSAYKDLLANKVIKLNRPEFAQNLAQKIDDFAVATGDPAWSETLQNRILKTIDSNIDKTGGLTGESYQALRSVLKDASKTNAKARDLVNFLDETVRNSAEQDIAQPLSKIDEKYRNMKIAEKLFGQLQNSESIRPETVYNAAKSSIPNLAYGAGGKMGDLAHLGRQLKPTIPDSGTATQLMGMGALAGAGGAAYFEPSVAAGALGTIGAAKGLNKLMTSKYLQEGASPAAQGFASGIEATGVIPAGSRALQQYMNAPKEQYDPYSDPELQSMLSDQNSYDPEKDLELQKLIKGVK